MSDSQWFDRANWAEQNCIIARRFDVTQSLVSSTRKRLGKQQPKNRCKRTGTNRNHEMWNRLDWKRQDIDIAEELHLTRERVRQIRKALGKPKAENHHMVRPVFRNTKKSKK